MPNPPEIAQLLLLALLPVEARESVAGDLLEEYRDSRVPASGEFRADLWYWRQVGGIWLRAYWWLVGPVVFLLVAGDVFKTLRPPSSASYLDGLPALARAAMSPFGLVALLGLANVYGSWRTRRWEGGLVASLGVSAIVWVFMLVWSNATFYQFAQVAQSNPQWIDAWQWSVQHGHAAPDETFRHWLYWDILGSQIVAGFVLFVAPCVYSSIGAILGEMSSHWRPVPGQKSSHQ